MNKSVLEKQLLNNVVQLTYIKKSGEHREMLCTKSKKILNSFEGQTILGFTPPKGRPKYDIELTDNIIVWDLEKRGFRTIAAAHTMINEVIPEEEYYEELVKDSLKSI